MAAQNASPPEASTGHHVHCLHVQAVAPDLVDESYVQAVLGFVYALIWLFGVMGNMTVLYIVLLRRVDFTVRTIFIVSLACSDLLMGFTSLPVTAVTIFSRRWLFTDFLCYSIGFLQASSVFVSSFTLITIAVDRYYLIYYPHSVMITYDKARIAVVVFWLVGGLLAIPMSAFAKIDRIDGVCGKYCIEQWPDDWLWGRRVYGLCVVSIQFGLPLIVCTGLYARISYRIRDQYALRLLTQRCVSAQSAARSLSRRRRSNRMMATMVASFILAWLPINLINLVRDFDLFDLGGGGGGNGDEEAEGGGGGGGVYWRYFTLTFAIGHAVAMSSLTINPIIYSWFNYKFRRAVKSFIGVGRGGGGAGRYAHGPNGTINGGGGGTAQSSPPTERPEITTAV